MKFKRTKTKRFNLLPKVILLTYGVTEPEYKTLNVFWLRWHWESV